jgi:CRISPR-associated endoribonuclease Cas6
MPYSLVLHCLSQNDALIPEDLQGQKTLALFLEELIQKQDAALAARLHAPQQSKPFTTALFTTPEAEGVWSSGRPKPRDARHGRAVYGEEVRLRFTFLDDMLYPLVSQFFLQHIGGMPLLRLGRSPLIISKVSVTPDSGEPWAGFARFEDMMQQVSEEETVWRIRFVTPTAFRSGDADIALPLPRLSFQSWLNSWDEHAPCPFFADRAERRRFLEDVVEGSVSVKFSQIRMTAPEFYFDGHRTREQGFTGSCQFSVKSAKTAPHHRKILGVLARYSFYAGTGRKTTMGMGVTQPIASEGMDYR